MILGPKEVAAIYNLIFPDKDRKEIEKMKLCFDDLVTIIKAAMFLLLVRKLTRGSSDPYYDLFEDWDLIVSSFCHSTG